MSITKELYSKLRAFESYSSWAIWAKPEEGKPKSNIEDLSVFYDPALLSILNDKYILIGLNASKHDVSDKVASQSWGAFHSDDKKRQQDYKLRFALDGTNYWGSYMTDILKGYPEKDSRKAIKYIKTLNNPQKSDEYIGGFIKELDCYETKPTLIAIGNAAEKILRKYFPEYKIVKIRHYSSWINKESYRKEVLNQLKGV